MDVFSTVINRLASLGYAVVGTDNETVKYNIARAEAELLALTNQTQIPPGLFTAWVDMATGLFLQDKKASGALSDVYDFSAPAKAISEGDTSVTFAIADTGSFEDQFDAMLAKLVAPNSELIARYRRLLW